MNDYNDIIDVFRLELIKKKLSFNKLESQIGLVKGSISQKTRNGTIRLKDITKYLDAIGKKLIITDK
tara:strand:+ start:2533 stop:2733 length:201 start_codon:yes stop_codon:yes gene_type:complete